MFWGNDSNSIGSPKVGFPFTASHPTHLTFKVAATGELPDIPSPSQIGLGAPLTHAALLCWMHTSHV